MSITPKRTSKGWRAPVQLARKRGVEPVQIALAWVLNQRATTVALVGPNSVKELHVAVGGVDITLNADEMAFLESLRSLYEKP